MDLWSLNLKGTSGSLCSTKPYHSCKLGKKGFRASVESWINRGIPEIGFSRLSPFPYPSLSARTRRKRNRGHSSNPGSSNSSIHPEDDSEGSNTDFGDMQSGDTKFNQSRLPIPDWRTFRANLVAREQLETTSPVQDPSSSSFSKPITSKWAHPIPVPETGCVLVATEKLDGTTIFERAVILLLRSGTNPKDSPFGVVINRPLYKKIRDMKTSNSDLTTTFADCSVHFGGPLDASMFLLTSTKDLPFVSFKQVMPGLSFGARNSLEEAAEMVKKGVLDAQDFRFFTGYAGWQFDQLREEVESNYWVVAACSSNLIAASPDSLEGLWEEILELMGGQYSELSRKPKQDNP